MENKEMTLKAPFTYYGGKQILADRIISLFSTHKIYIEPFLGGGAVFWRKDPSDFEILNDLNDLISNFYRVLQNDFDELYRLIANTIYSRNAHTRAWFIYNTPCLFTDIEKAWAVWTLANMSIGSQLSSSWGRDRLKNKHGHNLKSKIERLSEIYSERLRNVQIESKDALWIIEHTDSEEAFFYLDPPYFNANMGHYTGYTEGDFKKLLEALSNIKGKFLLSSYPSEILDGYTEQNKWSQIRIEQKISNSSKGKRKVEVLTANYPI